MARYKVYDAETENHYSNKRVANPFNKKNYVIFRGWKNQGDKKNSYSHHPVQGDGKWLKIENDITLLVGFNIKFDLLYEWESPELKKFFKRGGKIWDCQYAEYLINAQARSSQMASLDNTAVKYGGTKKIDEVKLLWESGMLTSQIDANLMIDYLVGTEDEGRHGGDIRNTELVYLGQLAKAIQLGMLPMIEARMDGLCATTEMEYNGLKIDIVEAHRRTKFLSEELVKVEEELKEYIPELPDGLEFNWGSPTHKSCLVFGGTIKYEKQTTYIDEATGELARKKATEEWPVFDGKPFPPKRCCFNSDTNMYSIAIEDEETPFSKMQDIYTSGKKKGSPKFQRVDVPGELKVKWQDFLFELPGYTHPDPKWIGAQKDGAGNPIYSTAAAVIETLGSRNIPFLKAMAKRQDIDKDLTTYYVRYDAEKAEYVGMLTCVDPNTNIVHHSLNHTTTVTTRLSSSNPNMQNIPTGATSEVKKMFVSRHAVGVMLEADYSQLEVVVQGMLSGDIQLCTDLRNKVDFHCKRVAAKYGCSYEEALYRCKDESYPHYHVWKEYRRGCKEFSFQRAYGAGAAAIAEKTGVPIDDIKRLIEIEERMYPGVKKFNDRVEAEVRKSAVPFKQFFPAGGYKIYRTGYYIAPTGTRYSFTSHDALAWQKEKGIQDSFMPTELKNYPVQGTGGEVVQIMMGRLWRHFVANDNYGGKALMCNQVHDSIWFDVDEIVVEQVAKDAKHILSNVPQVFKELYGMNVEVPFPVDIEVGKNLFTKHALKVA